MSPNQEASRECLEKAIDAEIKSLEESIRDLKLRRNALQPVSSLPPEIFAAIFSFFCLPDIPSLGGDPDQNLVRLHISHVCHQWREIALNQPQLWGHINFDAVSWAGAMEILDRAKLVPLYMETWVSGRYDDDRFDLFLKEVQARLPQIRHLGIGAKFLEIMYQGLEDALVSPAPTLEYLSFHCQEHRHWDMVDDQQLPIPDILVLDTLFGGSTPRLSCLKLRKCNITWNSPLFKSLKSLEIVTPYKIARPTLTVWLDTLDEIPQLETLILHSASPVADRFPFDVERTVTLPSLTHLDISASLPDCALAAAHLDLPALTSLCLSVKEPHTNASGVQAFLPYVAQHFHGPQDIRPLQSLLIHGHRAHNEASSPGLLAWPVPDIDTFVHDPPAFLGATFPSRVKLSFRTEDDDHLEIFKILMASLPLDGLLTLAAVKVTSPDVGIYDSDFGPHGNSSHSQDLAMQQFWLHLLPNLPLLRRVRLGHFTSQGFINALLAEDCKSPLLPSMTKLALAYTRLDPSWTHGLRAALMKRVDQGVPLETLDLRMCYSDPYNHVAVQLLGEIVIDVIRPLEFLGPEDNEKSSFAGTIMFNKMRNMWFGLSSYVPLLWFCGRDGDDRDDVT